MEILIGLVIGLAIGSSGVGGGTLTAPALMVLLGMEPAAAVATALAFSAFVKAGAAVTYWRRKQVNFTTLAYLLSGGLPGALIGALFLGRFHAGSAQCYVLIVVGTIVVASSLFTLWRLWKNAQPMSLTPKLLPVLSLPIGLELGFSSVGAGVLGTVLLLSCTTLAPAVVVGTDLSFGLVLSALSGGIHAADGLCNWHVMARLLPAGLFGSLGAALVAGRLPTRYLRAIVVVLAMTLGIVLLNKGAQQLRAQAIPANRAGFSVAGTYPLKAPHARR